MTESLMGFAVVAILASAVAAGLANMSSSRKAIAQKQEILNFRHYLQNEFNSAAACTTMIRGAQVDLGGVSQTTPSSTIIQIHGSSNRRGFRLSADETIEPVAVVGEPLKGTTTDIRIKDVLFKDITETGAPGEYQGFFEIQFNNTVSPVKPIRLRKTFTIDSAAGVISNCKGLVVQEEICKKTGREYDPVTESCSGGSSNPPKPPGDYLVTHAASSSPWAAAPTTCDAMGAPSTYHPSSEYTLIARSCYLYLVSGGQQTSTCNGTVCMWRWDGAPQSP